MLIHAGAGGVGYAAVQIALAHGAKVFATVSDDKRSIVEAARARSRSTGMRRSTDYVAEHTDGEGFDIVYDTLGGAITGCLVRAVKRYTGHVVSCLGWGSHSLAPLSFRAATYSGVFTLFPLLTGSRTCKSRAHSSARQQSSRSRINSSPCLLKKQFGRNEIAARLRRGSQGQQRQGRP